MTQPICDVLLPDGTRCGYVALGLTAKDRIADLHRHQRAYHVRSEVVMGEVKAQLLPGGKSGLGVPDEARAELHRQQTAEYPAVALPSNSQGCRLPLAPGQHFQWCGETDMGQSVPTLCEECDSTFKRHPGALAVALTDGQ